LNSFQIVNDSSSFLSFEKEHEICEIYSSLVWLKSVSVCKVEQNADSSWVANIETIWNKNGLAKHGIWKTFQII